MRVLCAFHVCARVRGPPFQQIFVFSAPLCFRNVIQSVYVLVVFLRELNGWAEYLCAIFLVLDVDLRGLGSWKSTRGAGFRSHTDLSQTVIVSWVAV